MSDLSKLKEIIQKELLGDADVVYTMGDDNYGLSDVLRVLQKNDNDYPIHIDFYFDRDGQLTITQAKGHPIINKECNWELSKLLSDQSDETIKFLLDILE